MGRYPASEVRDKKEVIHEIAPYSILITLLYHDPRDLIYVGR